jgi:hypothetical protein
LLHLNLNVSHSWRDLAINDEVGRWGRALPYLVLRYYFDTSLVLLLVSRAVSQSPHQGGLLLILPLVYHLSLLRGIHRIVAILGTHQRHLCSVKIAAVLLLLR